MKTRLDLICTQALIEKEYCPSHTHHYIRFPHIFLSIQNCLVFPYAGLFPIPDLLSAGSQRIDIASLTGVCRTELIFCLSQFVFPFFVQKIFALKQFLRAFYPSDVAHFCQSYP